MSHKLITGVYAALLTPRTSDGSLNLDELRSEVAFLNSRGVFRFAVNGATGEFTLTTPDELRIILTTIREASDGKAEMLCGVGLASAAGSINLAKIAEEHKVKALLLPMPYFFPYPQEDLNLFSRVVAQNTTLPILLYNLPQFTSGLDRETVRKLIVEVPNIIGIKDSSGSLDILRDLTEHAPDACRIVGNDSALCPAMIEGVLDGVVSGVACVLPEMITSIFAQTPTTADFERLQALLASFIEQLGPFPTPWGLKWIAQAREVCDATFNLPVTPHRTTQAANMVAWFREHESELTGA